MKLRPASLAFLCVAALSLTVLAQGCATSLVSQRDDKMAAPVAPAPAEATPVQQNQPATSPLPPPKGFVNDFANVLDGRTKEALETKLKLLKARAKIELAVATVDTTGEQDISDYSLAVARGWGIGPPAGEEGGGLLLLVAVKDRNWRIQVSRSLEADIPNDVAAEIGKRMTPSLRQLNYNEAVTKCVDDLIAKLAERRGFKMDDKQETLDIITKETPPDARRKP
jgi:uncharacterized membrane protein YgcG